MTIYADDTNVYRCTSEYLDSQNVTADSSGRAQCDTVWKGLGYKRSIAAISEQELPSHRLSVYPAFWVFVFHPTTPFSQTKLCKPLVIYLYFHAKCTNEPLYLPLPDIPAATEAHFTYTRTNKPNSLCIPLVKMKLHTARSFKNCYLVEQTLKRLFSRSLQT